MTSSTLRRDAEFAVVHAALVVAIGLFGALAYALLVARTGEFLWAAIDVVLIACALVIVSARRHVLGWTSLGGHRVLRLSLLVLGTTAFVIASQLVVHDANFVSLDESNYLATLRSGCIIDDGVAPFNMRWLVPLLAGPLDVVPASDAIALKAVNAGSLVVAGVYLTLLLVRLRVPRSLAFVAPVVMFSSYLGVYAATNRLVIDAFNYALYALIFHTLLERRHWRFFPWVLLVAAFNSEKAIYWIPVFGLLVLASQQRPLDRRALVGVAGELVRAAIPTVIYFVAMALYLRDSHTAPSPTFFENLHVMSFTWLAPGIHNETVRANNFQLLWFPFGAFTLYALLGLGEAPRRLRPIALLLVPIYVQTFIAYDTQRMVAYAFIVYVPFGFFHLARVRADVPRTMFLVWLGLALVTIVAQAYLLSIAALLPDSATAHWIVVHANRVKLWLSSAEVALVGALVLVHQVWYRRESNDSVAY